MNSKVVHHLALLRSPRSGRPLALGESGLVVEGTDERYHFVGPSAVLVAESRPEHLTAPDSAIVAANIPSFTPPPEYARGDCVVLHLGCGAVGSSSPNTLSLDVLPLPNVDIVAEAERLPFADETIDYVVSGAVLEHVRDPVRAVDEIKRVLRPGGKLRIDTAFMQSYHGFPGHYFNMTPLAVEAYVGGAFELEQSAVAPNSSELMSIHSLLARFASYLDPDAKRRFEAQTVGELIANLDADHGFSNPLIARASDYARRAMCASYFVVARKPERYDPTLERDPIVLRYYEARMAVLLRDHEIDLYRRFATSQGEDVTHLPLPPQTVQSLLAEAAPARATRDEFTAATARLAEIERRLITFRDRFILAYLEALERSKPASAKTT